MTTFVDTIGARDLVLADDSKWTTPAADLLPNSDNATNANDGAATSAFDDPGEDFDIPWGTNDFTWEAWVRFTTDPVGTAGPQAIMLFGDADGDPHKWDVRINAATYNSLSFTLVAAANYQVATTTPLTAGSWWYVVFALKSSLGLGAVGGRTLTAYVNGVSDTVVTMPSTTYTPSTLSSPTLHFGNNGLFLNTPTYMEIGKVAIYHRILTGGELTDHYDAMTT